MPLKIIDLFAGAGGLTLGFVPLNDRSEFECVLSVEFDRAAAATHETNFGSQVISEDIEAWLASEPEIPAADVVMGGPPCQGFSMLNKKREGDARRALWEPFMQVVEMCGARAFLMENVPGLLKSEEFQNIKRCAEKMGFTVQAEVLNAADYGAPQQRRRAVIAGWKGIEGRLHFPPLPTHCDPAKINGSDPALLPWKTVRQAIADLPPLPEGTAIRDVPPPLDLHFGRTPTELSKKRYRLVPEGGNRFDLQRAAPELTPDCWLKKKTGSTDIFGRLWWDRPSVTIRTEFFKPEKGRYLHPVEHRPITHREAARLMGFPDDFCFTGSKNEIARQIGNAVPPALAAALAGMFLEAFGGECASCSEAVRDTRHGSKAKNMLCRHWDEGVTSGLSDPSTTIEDIKTKARNLKTE